MAELSQALLGSQSAGATGATVPDVVNTTAVETTTERGEPLEMEDDKNVKDDVGLTIDGKTEGGERGGRGTKESADHRECKLEKQEITLGMKHENDENETCEKDEGNAKDDIEAVKGKVKLQSREHTAGGDKLESAEDLEAHNDVEHMELKNKYSGEIKRQESQTSQLDKLEDVNKETGKDEGRKVKSVKLKDVKDANDSDARYQGNECTEEQKRKGGIKKQVEEESKKQLTASELDKTDNADHVLVKAGRKDGVDHEKEMAENLGKKYKRKKHVEKQNKHGIDATGYPQDVKGRESKKEKPIDELEDIANNKKENGEHDAEGTELEKLEEQDVKDEEGLCQGDEKSDDENEIKHESIENVKIAGEAELEDSDSEDVQGAVESDGEEKVTKRNLSQGKRARESREKGRNGRKTVQGEPTTPGLFADRPVRERKTVVRLVEVIEKEQGEGFHIEKGRGALLKDIPNVNNKLSRRKPEDIKLLHYILFGRKGKATDFKSHISQFSGFVWPENEEKQKTKVKEKLDKCPGPKLLDLCDLFDITVSRATAKEELVGTLLNFLIAPYPIADVKLSEIEQHSSVKRKRPSGGGFSGTVDSSSSKPLKKRRTGSSFNYSVDTKDKDEKGGEEDRGRSGNGHFTGNQDSDHSGSEKDNDSIENVNVEDLESSKKKESKKEKNKLAKKLPSLKKTPLVSSGSEDKKSTSKHTKAEEPHDSGLKVSATKHVKAKETHGSGSKILKSKHTKADDTHDSGPKVFSRRKKVDTPEKQSSKMESRVKDIGRKLGSCKLKSDKTEPNKDELRKMISVILKEVDFNTATFKDILKQLGTRFKTDLTHMKEEIKFMTKEELVKIADEEANSDDDEESSNDEETAQPATKRLRT